MLKRVLDRAVLDRAIPINPCVGPRRPPAPAADQGPAGALPAEVEELATAAPDASDRLLIRLLAYAGLRIGEALALRRRDVDLERKLLTVRESVGEINGHLVVGPTKTYAVRTITLPDSLVGELRAHLESVPTPSQSLLFSDPGRRASPVPGGAARLLGPCRSRHERQAH